MRKFGAQKAAIAATRHAAAGDASMQHMDEAPATQAPQELDASRYNIEEGDGSSHAQRIVRELYLRYQKQLQRWRDYRNLFFFLGFVALFLAVLYLQRQANTAYKVHATLSDVLVPSSNVMGSTDDVYAWLVGVLGAVWVDPKCGDGLCESPFEFASYSRFGCRADCGKLQDVQKLTKLQIDIYFDFSHPIGSMAASDLMQQATWNLCPVQTAYSGDCYYDTDVAFDRLSGSTTTQILDAPDGDWDLIVRRDIFNKIRGAVRSLEDLTLMSYYYRIYIAALSVIAEQNFEMNLLSQAVATASTPLLTYMNNTVWAGANNNATLANFQFSQLINATCACDNVPVNSSTTVTWGAEVLRAFNNSVDFFDPSQPFTADVATYKAQYCTAFSSGSPLLLEPKAVNVTANGIIAGEVPTGVNYTTTTIYAPTTNVTAYCSSVLNSTVGWRSNMTTTVQRMLIDKRLGDSRTTGKIASRNTVYNQLRNNIILNFPELFDPVFTNPRGSLAMGDLNMYSATVTVLQEQFLLGVTFFSKPQPAYQNMTRSRIYNANITMLSMLQRAQARIAEVAFEQNETLNIIVPTPSAAKYPNVTVQDVLNFFAAAGATNATLPDASNPNLGPLATTYNLVSWPGNTTAYMQCALDQRGPSYLGQCVAMNVSCVSTTNDTTPYNCTDLATNQTVPGNLTVTSYRTTCETECDRQLDCNTLCECYTDCSVSLGQPAYCECDACVSLSLNAAADTQFIDIQNTAISGGQSAANIASLGLAYSDRRRGRYLMQTSTDLTTQLGQVLTQVSAVRTQQDTITGQMSKLQSQVDQANALAEARANDNRLIDLIQAGRQDIAAGQARVEAKLDEIIGKQNQSLAAAEAATQALSAIKSLADKQLAAQQALERAVTNQLNAIKTASFSGLISLTQALALWKRARRDRALTMKAAQLANIPCTNYNTADNEFNLDNGNSIDNTTARERNIGLTNRVIGGMLLHQYRTNDTNCTESKFSKIQQTCTGPTTLKSFGVDPIFKRGTDLYNADYDDINGVMVLNWYNCSLLDNPTYNVSFQNSTSNPEPYCAELYNSQKLPYAFYHFPLRDKEPGFPVYFDINLSQDGATTWETYLEQGLYLDQHTRQLTAELITYNAPLRIFGYFYCEFFFSDGGSIKVTYRLHTVRVELYNGYDDDVRYGLEIVLSIWIFCMMLHTLWQIIMTQKRSKNFLKFFANGWNCVDFISNGLLTACMAIWWVFVTQYAKPFDISLRHDVYQGLQPDANYLALNNEGGTCPGCQMTKMWDEMHDLKDLIDMLNWYFALNGINILLLIARVLRLMDFQPRLGVVTRSLWLAGPDLIHFAIVAGMVFVGYAMMAHLIFGNAIEAFQTFGDSVNTCFEILLGNIDVNQDLRALGGLQSVAGALFFWSYELLVFMVLLNFLLAIIVDAFSEVKEKTHETVGIHTELYQLMRDKWRSMLGSCSANYISDARLGSLLKQWAGEEEEDEQKNEDAEVQKLLTILNEDLDEDDLRNVLMECLKDAPGVDENEKAAQPKGLMRLLPQRRRIVATPHEVAQAAKYIVDRFGVPVEAEEELFGEEAPAPEPAAPAAAAVAANAAAIDKERDQLASALERLAEVQRELADGQRNLMGGQKQLAEQQAKLVSLMNTDGAPPPPQ